MGHVFCGTERRINQGCKPSPEVVYQMNPEYLGERCKLISETYNREVVWKDEEYRKECVAL